MMERPCRFIKIEVMCPVNPTNPVAPGTPYENVDFGFFENKDNTRSQSCYESKLEASWH